MKSIFILFCFVFLTSNSFPQINPTINNNSKNKIPKYDLHLGLGQVSGLRIGGRYLINNRFSIETSIGFPVFIFPIAVSEAIDLTLGMNYRLSNKKNFVFSFITAFTNISNDNQLKLTYLSSTIGVMILNKKGGHLFLRLGPFVDFNKTGYLSKKITYGINIDLGFNFVF